MIPTANKHPNQKAQKHAVRSVHVHGVELAIPPAIVMTNARFTFDDYISIEMQSGVLVTSLANNWVAIFKDTLGKIEGYKFDIVHGWQPIAIPASTPLPQPSLYDRVQVQMSRTAAIWLPFDKLPIFGQSLEFDGIAGTIGFIDLSGQQQTITLSDSINQSFDIDVSSKLNGTWEIRVCGLGRLNIYRTDVELGYVARVRFRNGNAERHVLLDQIPLNSIDDLGLLFLGNGFVIVAHAAIPIKLDITNQWKLHLAANTTVDSLGDGFLLVTDAGKNSEYFYDKKWCRFYKLRAGCRELAAPWIMDCAQSHSTTVCSGAITLFSSGSAEVFGKLVQQDEAFDIYGPGKVHAFRYPDSEWIYVVEGTQIQCGVYEENVFRDKDGSFSAGWGWGSEADLPCSSDRPAWVYFAGVLSIGFVFMLCIDPGFVLSMGFWAALCFGAAWSLKQASSRLMDWYESVHKSFARALKLIASRFHW